MNLFQSSGAFHTSALFFLIVAAVILLYFLYVLIKLEYYYVRGKREEKEWIKKERPIRIKKLNDLYESRNVLEKVAADERYPLDKIAANQKLVDILAQIRAEERQLFPYIAEKGKQWIMDHITKTIFKT